MANPSATGPTPELSPPPTAPKSPTISIPKTPKPGKVGEPIPPPDPLKIAKAYKLSRRMRFRGLDISIETDKGEKRHWYDPHNKTSGSTTMSHPYGYIRRTKGVDGDHVDVYVGPHEDAKNVYVVHQMKAPDFKKYDEDKCMLGWTNAADAKAAYLKNFDDKRFFGSMTAMPFEQFKKKALGTFTRPQKIARITVDTSKAAYAHGVMQACNDYGFDIPVKTANAALVPAAAGGAALGGLLGMGTNKALHSAVGDRLTDTQEEGYRKAQQHSATLTGGGLGALAGSLPMILRGGSPLQIAATTGLGALGGGLLGYNLAEPKELTLGEEAKGRINRLRQAVKGDL